MAGIAWDGAAAVGEDDRIDIPRRVPGAPTGPLSRTTLMAMRRLAHAFREGWILDDRLPGVARLIVDDARRGGLAAEQMVVAVKHAWAGLAELHATPHVAEARVLLDRLVSRCIRDYFARAPHGTSHGASHAAPLGTPVPADARRAG